MSDANDEERELRITLMNVQIDQGRLNIEKMKQEMAVEQRRYMRTLVIQTVGSLAAAMAAGAAIFGLILRLTGRL